MKDKTFAITANENEILTDSKIQEFFFKVLQYAEEVCGNGKVLILPPDATRLHSQAGVFTKLCAGHFAKKVAAVMPALGTHTPMNNAEIHAMYDGLPPELFCEHNWRTDTIELGRLTSDYVKKITNGACNYDLPIEVNKRLLGYKHPQYAGKDQPASLIVSIGQVVPHEVFGMSNHTKNIFVGCGGKKCIDKSHYISALCGIENILGQTDNPVRSLFDEAFRQFSPLMLPIMWVLTVVDINNALRGVFAGFGRDCFVQAAALSEKVNITVLEKAAKKIVVYLDPKQYRSTWVGNKAIYRTRQAIEQGGRLVILAGGLETFGEDTVNDTVIRKYGYCGAAEIKRIVDAETQVKMDISLPANLGAAAHLIHGSSEGRFTTEYCTANLDRAEIESVGFEWGDLEAVSKKYTATNEGWHSTAEGEQYYFIGNPAGGLWCAPTGNSSPSPSH